MPEMIVYVVQPVDLMKTLGSGASIIISIAAIVISVITYKSQVRHNRNSVRPILDIICGDYDDDIYVRIDNVGVGPATINDIKCSIGSVTRNSLYELLPLNAKVMPEAPKPIRVISIFPLNDYVENLARRTIIPGKEIILLQRKDPDEWEQVALRGLLKEATIKIEYTDVYGKETWTAERKLDFFERNLPDDFLVVPYEHES